MDNNIKELIGKRVRLKRDVERYPDFVAFQGMEGVIQNATSRKRVVKMDEKLDGAQAWNNCVIWDSSSSMENLIDFYDDVEVLDDEPFFPVEKFDLNK